MLVSIPLTDDEQAAVEDGQAALDHLLQRLADVPTPAGTTPRELNSDRHPAADHRRQQRPTSTNLTILIPQNGGEMPASLDRSSVPGVERLNGYLEFVEQMTRRISTS